MIVYWAHMKGMNLLTDGYVGVTRMPLEERLKFHDKNNRFPVGYSVEVIFEGTEEECLAKEFELRPREWIGWNIAKGGQAGNRPKGIHTSGWKHSEESKKRRSQMWMGNNFGNKETIVEGITFESQKAAIAYLKEKYGFGRGKAREHILKGTPIEELLKYRYNSNSLNFPNQVKRKDAEASSLS